MKINYSIKEKSQRSFREGSKVKFKEELHAYDKNLMPTDKDKVYIVQKIWEFNETLAVDIGLSLNYVIDSFDLI